MEPIPERVAGRLRERITVSPNGCWMWPGSTASGYGRIAWSHDGRMIYRPTHRVMYELEVGPIPDGLDLDHLCHDPTQCRPVNSHECPHRRCCNPAHLQPSTRQENLLRGGTIPAERSSRTHCPYGHAYAGDNLFFDKLGRRCCRECVRAKNRSYYWRNVERRAEYNRQWRASRQPDTA